MEVIAVYSESPIKTYGLHEFSNLVLVRLEYNPALVGEAEDLLMKLSAANLNYQVAVVQNLTQTCTVLQFVIDREQADQIGPVMSAHLRGHPTQSPPIYEPVEMVYFSGPHYGDRYGVAAAAFTAIEEAGLSVILAGFSASSVYLVLPKGSTEKLRPCWAGKFEVPSKT